MRIQLMDLIEKYEKSEQIATAAVIEVKGSSPSEWNEGFIRGQKHLSKIMIEDLKRLLTTYKSYDR